MLLDAPAPVQLPGVKIRRSFDANEGSAETHVGDEVMFGRPSLSGSSKVAVVVRKRVLGRHRTSRSRA